MGEEVEREKKVGEKVQRESGRGGREKERKWERR